MHTHLFWFFSALGGPFLQLSVADDGIEVAGSPERGCGPVWGNLGRMAGTERYKKAGNRVAPSGELRGSYASDGRGTSGRGRSPWATPFGVGHVRAWKPSFHGLWWLALGSILRHYETGAECDGPARGCPQGNRDHRRSAQCTLMGSHCLILREGEEEETVKMELRYAV